MMSPFVDKHQQPLTWGQALHKIKLRFVSYWLDLVVASVWVLSYLPSHWLRRLLLKLAGVHMGRKSYVHIGIRLYDPRHITIGEGTIIGDHATLDGRAPLSIGHHVDIASGVMIYNSEHDLHSPTFNPIEQPVTIGDYVFIGPRAIILPGVDIGAGAAIAAGAVVTKAVSPGDIVGGVPAKVIGHRSLTDYHYRLGRPRLFQ